MPRAAARLAAVLLGLLGGDRASAQCLEWSTQFSTPTWPALAMTSHDDGTVGQALYVGSPVGVTRRVAGTWTLLPGLSGSATNVMSFRGFDDGTGLALYAGGDFDLPSPGIAKWMGTAWTPVGGGLAGGSIGPGVAAMAVFDDGSGPALYMGGNFTGGWNGQTFLGSKNIIKWDGSAWSGVAGGTASSSDRVLALAVFNDGTGDALYATGTFSSIGGVPAIGVAKWNGSSWSALPGGPPSGGTSLQVFDDGAGPALFLGGGWPSVGGAPAYSLAKWDGTSWSIPASDWMAVILGLAVFDDGAGLALYAAGISAPPHSGNVGRWDGANWSVLGQGVDAHANCITVHDDGTGPDLFLGGEFHHAGDGVQSEGVAEWYGCHAQISSMCAGDGTYAACPCHNSGSSGRGCANSTGLGGALLTWSGGTNPDTLTLTSSFEPSTAGTIFLEGTEMAATPILFGDGIRCAGGDLLRLYVKNAVAGSATAPQAGDLSISQRSANLGFPILPGQIRYFQTYYRDGAPGFCVPPSGSNFNAANAIRVVW